MADLGAIGHTFRNPGFSRVAVAAPAVMRDGIAFRRTGADNNGMLKGTVRKAAVVQEGVVVCLYFRDSKMLIATTVTDALGRYKFAGLDRNMLKRYFALAFDPVTGAPFNHTAVQDRLTAGTAT